MAEKKEEAKPMFKCGKCGVIQPINEGLICCSCEGKKEEEGK